MRLSDFELRPPVAGDQDAFLAAAATSADLWAGWGTPPATLEAFHEWVARHDGEHRHQMLAFHLGELVGAVNIQNIVRGQGQYAVLGYFAFAQGAGRGLMRRAVALGVDVAFEELDLHRVEAGIRPENERSLAIVRALGFRYEGLLTRLLLMDGEWRDHELWATDTEDWPGAAALFD